MGGAGGRRVVCRQGDPAWQAARHRLIGASQIAILFGEQPWPKDRSAEQKRLDLVAEKRLPAPAPFRISRHMWWGDECEPANMRAFARIVGCRVRPCRLLLENAAAPGLGATLDGLVYKARPRGFYSEAVASSDPTWVGTVSDALRAAGRPLICEMKQTEAWFRKEWVSGVPAHYLLQVQAQLLVSGLPGAVIACRIGAADMLAHMVEADPVLHDEIRSRVAAFWGEVQGA